MKRILSTLLMTMLMGMTTAMAEELRVAEMTPLNRLPSLPMAQTAVYGT